MQTQRTSNLLPWLLGAAALLAVLWLLDRLSAVLAPFITAAVLAYILDPLVDRLQEKGLSRTAALLLVMLSGFFTVLGLLLIVVPMLISQAQALATRLPVLVDFIQHSALPWLNQTLGTSISIDSQGWRAALADNAAGVRQALTRLAPQLGHGGALLLHTVTNLALLPVLLYYFLHGWDDMVARVATLVPRRWHAQVGKLAGEVDDMLGQFLRGQLSVMLIMALIYGGGLASTGLDSGLAIGIVAGLLVFIPYLGAFTGLLLATLSALLQFGSLGGLLLVWGVFACGQLLESFVVTPRLVGERIGLSPMTVIFALMAFGELLGFAGVLLALPLSAITVILGRHLIRHYFNSSFYQRRIDP
ncbi:AI-2E family transporter [Vogesella sp. LIG4]|uniref:AI-2E family transporter n=1 Tax=Vogesella sp. LIG4 TaxID=1192162 RepID=UPI001390520D|nr:AI-2E family transporter [Vogesella sp. LIG4]